MHNKYVEIAKHCIGLDYGKPSKRAQTEDTLSCRERAYL